MPGGVSVVIPWGSADPDRQRALAFVTAHYWALGYDVHVTPCESDVWSKGEAVAAGVKAAVHDVLVIADADVLCAAVPEAVAQVPPHKWVVPWRQIFRLGAEATEAVYAGADPTEVRRRPGALARRVYGGVPGGGLVVMQRSVYEATPMDPRFLGWGGEDVSWGYALTALHGPPLRLRGEMTHLWHQPEERGHEHTKANHRLAEQYRAARNSPGRIRRVMAPLVDETTAVWYA